jgi:hypothetical protein
MRFVTVAARYNAKQSDLITVTNSSGRELATTTTITTAVPLPLPTTGDDYDDDDDDGVHIRSSNNRSNYLKLIIIEQIAATKYREIRRKIKRRRNRE